MPAPSFASFRRQLSVGTRVHIDNLKFPHLTGERTLSKVQGNAIAAPATRADGSVVEVWIYWPRANETQMQPDGRLSLLNPETRQPWLIITVLS